LIPKEKLYFPKIKKKERKNVFIDGIIIEGFIS